MNFDNAFVKAVAKGERLDNVKQLTPEQAFKLGLLVRKYEQEKQMNPLT